MNRQAYGARVQRAVEEIGRKTGIDITRSALRKAPNTQIFRLFQLEAIAAGIPEPEDIDIEYQRRDAVRAAVAILDGQKGIGEITMEKIRENLADLM